VGCGRAYKPLTTALLAKKRIEQRDWENDERLKLEGKTKTRTGKDKEI
jgi:hypothetical protein